MGKNVFELPVETAGKPRKEEEIIVEGIEFITNYIELFKKRLTYNVPHSFTDYEFYRGPYMVPGNKKIQFEQTKTEIQIRYSSIDNNTFQEVIDILKVSRNDATLESGQSKKKLDTELINTYLIKVI